TYREGPDSGCWAVEQLAGIERADGIEGMLDRPHDPDLGRGEHPCQRVALALTDAMLGAYGTVQGQRDVLDRSRQITRAAAELRIGHARRRQDVEMNIAVADVTERNRHAARNEPFEFRLDPPDELRST